MLAARTKWSVLVGLTAAPVLLLEPVCAQTIVQEQVHPSQVTSSVNLNLGLEYETGDYGTGTVTDTWYFPATISYTQERLVLQATFAYAVIDGPGVLLGVNTGATHHSGTRTTRADAMSISTDSRTILRRPVPEPEDPDVPPADGRESGLSDPSFAVSYEIVQGGGQATSVWLVGRMKWAIADTSKRLSTGENDYAVAVSATTAPAPLRYFGALGYEVIGDPPGQKLNNIFYGSAGASVPLGWYEFVGASLDWSQSATPGAGDELDLTFFGGFGLKAGRTVNGYLFSGLTRDSADYGLGIFVNFPL